MSEDTDPIIRIPNLDGEMVTVYDFPGWEALSPDAIMKSSDSWAYVIVKESSSMDFRQCGIPRMDGPNQTASSDDIGQTVAVRQGPPFPRGWWPFRLLDEETAVGLAEGYDGYLREQAVAASPLPVPNHRHEYHLEVLPLP